MNKWKSAVFLISFGVMLVFPGAVISYADTYSADTYSCSTELENLISTGDVSISLAEYEFDAQGREVPYQNEKVVLPGQRISKIVRITNQANDVWLRAKVSFWSEDGICDMHDDMLGELGPEWVQRGEYFYYTEPVLSSQSVEWFRELRIPQDWGAEAANGGFSVNITAEAIQANGFTPDFSQDLPWFGIPVEECIHSGHEIAGPGQQSPFSLIFEGGSEGFFRSRNDFFEHFASLLPGDTMSGTMEIGSQYYRPVKIWFRSEIPDQQPEISLQLLEALILKIQRGEEVLYEGSMTEERLGDGIVLVSSLKKEDLQNVEFSVHMPAELTNEMALQQAKVRWIFSAEDFVSDGLGGGSGSSGSSDNDSRQTAGITVMPELITDSAEWVRQTPEIFIEVLHKIPKLGDTGTGGLLFGVMMLSSILFGILALHKGKKQDDRRRSRHEKERI